MMTGQTISVRKDLIKREITLERTAHAPRALVWEGWTQPEHIARWWGPKGWTTTVYAMDVRPGGIWHYCMRPDYGSGDAVWGRVVYQAVSAPSSIEYLEMASDAECRIIGAEQRTARVDFLDLGNATTRIVICYRFQTLEALRAAEKMGISEGFNETLDRLEAYVQAQRGLYA